MSNANTDTTNPRRSRKPLWFGAAAVTVVLVLAGTFMVPALTGTDDLYDRESSESHGLFSDPDAEIARAIAEMNAIAQGAAQAMAEAGAAAEADFNATAQASAESVASAADDADAEVTAAGSAAGKVLEDAPTDFDGNASSAADAVGEMSEGSSYQADVEYKVPQDVEAWEEQNASARTKLALGVPLTGNSAIDGHIFAAVEAYVNVRGNVTGVEEALANATDGITVGIFTGKGGILVTGEDASYMAAPDENAAIGAYAEAQAILDAGYAGLEKLLSGVNVTAQTQLELEAAVRAELEAMIEAQAKAEAEIDAQLEARTKATFQASAEAEAEAHAEAEARIQAAIEAHAEARQKVHAQAEAQAAAVFEKSAATAQSLELQAEAALAQADEVSAAIWASANATLAVLAKIEETTGTDTSAQAAATAQAAASAEAAARAKAQATASLLARQAAAVRASAQARAEVVVQVAVKAEARLDATLAASIDMTLKAEAYTKAKIHARAQATVEAHVQAAIRAKARVDASYTGQAHFLLDAAMKANAAAYLSVDGSRGIPEMIRSDASYDVARDAAIVRDVAQDYDQQKEYGLDYEDKAAEWNSKADELDTENDVMTGMTYLADSDIDKQLTVIGVVGHNLNAMGQQYL